MLKTSKILGLAIATILAAYTSELSFSHQAFAQGCSPTIGCKPVQPDDALGGSIADTTQQVNKMLSGELGHLGANLGTGGAGGVGIVIPTDDNELSFFSSAGNSGNVGHILTKLVGQTTKSVLGDVCLSCWNGFAEHETQQANEQATGLLGGINSHAEGTNTIAGVLTGGQGQQGQTTTGNLGSTAPSGGTGSGSTLGSTANTQCPNLSPANSASSSSSEPFRCIGG